MKNLNLIFNLLLFPFLFIGAYLGRLFTFGNKGYHYHLTPFVPFALLILLPLYANAAIVDDDYTITPPDTSVSGNVITNDSHGNHNLRVKEWPDPAHGTLSNLGTDFWGNYTGTFTYIPDAGYTGTDTFSYTARYWSGGWNGSWVDSGTAIVTITVNAAVNLPPIAVATVTPTSGPTGTTFSFDGTGSTDDGGVANLVYTWKEGTVTLGSGSTFSKNDFAVGSHTITLTVTDTGFLSDTFNIDITVTTSGGGGGTEPAACPTGTSTGDRPFCLRKKITAPGNMVTIGNTFLVPSNPQAACPTNPITGNAYLADTTTKNQNTFICKYSSDGTTTPSTSATIVTTGSPTNIIANPQDSKLLWAGLYWQSRSSTPGQAIKIKNGTDAYVDITPLKVDKWSSEDDYSAFADITTVLNNNNWLAGTYTVANIPTRTGKISGHGAFGAWTLVLIYENQDEKLRNFSIFDGYDKITSSNDVTIPISGFYTPKAGDISSVASIFVGEGDKNIPGDRLEATSQANVTKTLTNASDSQAVWSAIVPDFPRTPSLINNQGIDIQAFQLGTDGYDILEHTDSQISFKFTSTGDVYWPSMIAFNTELYAPKLCYDYAYKQNGIYFTEDNNGSFDPRIVGSGLSSDDIVVELFIRNDEESDTNATNMTIHITDINASQAAYVHNSAYTTLPQHIYSDPSTPNPLQDIYIGNVGGKEYFSIDYNLSLTGKSIDMPINANLEYTLILADSSGNPVAIDYNTTLSGDIPLCTNLNFAYYPDYDLFNVENSALSVTQKYNLPTQTANRAGDFKVTSYEKTNVHARNDITTMVAVELIDANKYHDIKASCVEPDSALTPRVWVVFDNNTSITDFDKTTIDTAILKDMVSDSIVNSGGTPIAEAEDYYSFVRENTAFRISYNNFGDNDIQDRLEPADCKGNYIAPCYVWKNKSFTEIGKLDVGKGEGICAQDMANGQDTIPQWCGNNGTKGLDAPHLAECMECLYGFGIKYVCSRDNFSLRPESFRIRLDDQEQNTTTPQKQLIAYNNDPLKSHGSGSSGNGDRIVAGYNYSIDINATNHQNDNATPGYRASFKEDGDGGLRTFQLKWWSNSATLDNACNDISDHNKSATFYNGSTSLIDGSSDQNISNNQIGKYDLNLFDKLWTRVDWDSDYMAHHTTYSAYFVSNEDCAVDSSAVPTQNSSTTSYTDDMSGCDISTANHINSDDNNIKYTDMPLYIFPYTFDQSSIIPVIGPKNNGQSFVYIDTPPTLNADDTNMSYNMNGTFYAAGYDTTVKLSNFVTGCYADDINMDLNFTYNHQAPVVPATTPFLSYSLKDHNTSDTSIVYRPAVSGPPNFITGTHNSIRTPFIILQGKEFFAKEMKGAITMNLGYNFNRAYNQLLNPRLIEMHDFNITYATQPSNIRADLKTGNDFKIFGDQPLHDQNVTFLYGRAKPSKFFYEDVTTASITTPVSIVAYCDIELLGFTECQDRMRIMLNDAGTNEANWWLSLDHKTADGDGNVMLKIGTVSEGSGTPAVTPASTNGISVITNATANGVSVARGANPTLPMTVEIDLDQSDTIPLLTNKWLIYNEYLDDVNTSPFYKVRFIGEGNWTGIGKEGMVVGTEASKRKTKRLDW